MQLMGSISLVLSNSHILLLLKGFTPPQSETGMANNKRLDNIQLQRLFLHSTGIQLLELLPTTSKSIHMVNKHIQFSSNSTAQQICYLRLEGLQWLDREGKYLLRNPRYTHGPLEWVFRLFQHIV